MEAIGAVATVVGLLDLLAKRLVEFRVRLDRFQQHFDDFETLVATQHRLSEKLKELQISIPSKQYPCVDMSLIQKHVTGAQSVLSSLSKYLDNISVKQRSQASGSSSRTRKRISDKFPILAEKRRIAFQRTTRIEESLSSARNELDCAWRVLNDLRLARIEEGVKAVSGGERDRFLCNVVVTPNPENLVFDFESRDEKGIAVTCEGQLKVAVLGVGCSSRIGVIDGGLIGAIGTGGMGKSCAVRALACLEEVREHFPGGIYEVSLGMDAGTLKLRTELCNCIRDSGGMLLARELLATGNTNEIIRGASRWFGRKKVLFIVDDVWEDAEIGLNVLFSLKRLLSYNGSCMILTSRSSAVKVLSRDVIEFGLRGTFSKTSKDMLLKSAQLKEEYISVCTNSSSVGRMLEVCGGLPVALAVAGQLVREYGVDFKDPFEPVLSKIRKRAGAMRNYALPGYGALSDLLEAALQFCERRHGQEWNRRSGKSFEEFVQSLCVIQKQQFAPSTMLQRLWEFECERRAEELVRILKNVGVVQEEVRSRNGRELVGIRLHDLVHEHIESKVGGKSTRFHSQLLRSYMSEPEDVKKGRHREWWKINAEANVYLYENLCRHLIMAGLVGEAVSLLLDPRWTVSHIYETGAGQAMRDYEMVLYEASGWSGVGEFSESQIDIRNRIEALGLVKDAVRLSLPYVSRNWREIWFQLYGRLVESKHVSGVGQYLERIELYAGRPWLKAEPGCLQPAGGSVHRTWISEGEKGSILHTWFGQDGSVRILRRTRDEETATYDVLKMEEGVETEPMCIWSIKSRNQDLYSVVCKSGSKLGLVMENRVVEVWDMANNMRLKCDEVENVTDVGQFSPDGTMWAFVCCERNIRIWDTDGENVTEICVLRNKSNVSCLCWSGDGKAVAVGCSNGRVLVWDLNTRSIVKWYDLFENGEAGKSEAVDSNSSGREVDSREAEASDTAQSEEWLSKIQCVAWAGDGRRIATSSSFRGACIWDLASEQDGKPALLFASWWTCGGMMWSPNGRCLAVVEDDEVKLLEMQSGQLMDLELVQSSPIKCWNWSACGKQLVTVDTYNRVHVARISTTVRSHGNSSRRGERWIQAKVCQDGTVVAASSDKGISIWKQQRSQAVDVELMRKEMDLCPKGYAIDMALTANGELLAAIFKHKVQVWEVRDRELVFSKGSEFLLRGVALSANGSTVAAVTLDGKVLVWSVHKEQRPNVFITDMKCPSLTLSRDGRFISVYDCSTSYQRDRCQVEVWTVGDSHSAKRCASLSTLCNVHKVSFNDSDDVLVEFDLLHDAPHSRDTDRESSEDAVRFSVWRWRSSRTPETPSLDKCAYARRYSRTLTVFDSLHTSAGTLDKYIRTWEYNTKMGVLAMISGDERLFFACLEKS